MVEGDPYLCKCCFLQEICISSNVVSYKRSVSLQMLFDCHIYFWAQYGIKNPIYAQIWWETHWWPCISFEDQICSFYKFFHIWWFNHHNIWMHEVITSTINGKIIQNLPNPKKYLGFWSLLLTMVEIYCERCDEIYFGWFGVIESACSIFKDVNR